jgi:hypothetical protein
LQQTLQTVSAFASVFCGPIADASGAPVQQVTTTGGVDASGAAVTATAAAPVSPLLTERMLASILSLLVTASETKTLSESTLRHAAETVELVVGVQGNCGGGVCVTATARASVLAFVDLAISAVKTSAEDAAAISLGEQTAAFLVNSTAHILSALLCAAPVDLINITATTAAAAPACQQASLVSQRLPALLAAAQTRISGSIIPVSIETANFVATSQQLTASVNGDTSFTEAASSSSSASTVQFTSAFQTSGESAAELAAAADADRTLSRMSAVLLPEETIRSAPATAFRSGPQQTLCAPTLNMVRFSSPTLSACRVGPLSPVTVAAPPITTNGTGGR